MNYLAHLFLSGDKPEIIFGNMLEDFITGRVNHARLDIYSEEIKKGIRLHREIDTFIDTNSLVKEAKFFFYNDYGKYSSIIIDVLFDHLLSINWKEFTSEEFPDFRKRVYAVFPEFDSLQPPTMKYVTDSMISNDWLKNYQFRWGLERAFSDLNKRTKVSFNFMESITTFEQFYLEINEIFLQFFPLVMVHCEKFLEKNGEI